MSGTPDSWQALRGGWINKQGTLVCQQSNQTAQIVYGSTGWATQRVDTTVLWSGGAAGVMLRYNNLSKNYYAFTAYAQSSILQLELVSSNFNRTALASYSSLPGISVAQDFKLTAEANGSNLRAYVNDIKYLDVTDTNLSAGQVGFDWQQGQGQFRDVHVNVNLPDGSIAPVTLPTDFGAYCAVDDVKSLLTGIPVSDVASDDDIYMYIKDASDMINRTTYSSFGRGIRVEERYDGTGQFTLVLGHSPIVKLHRLIIYNFNNTAIRSWSPGLTAGTTDDSENPSTLIVENNLGLITIPPQQITPTLISVTPTYFPTVNPLAPGVTTGTEYDYFNRFGRGVRNVLVEYSYGYQTVPEQIRWATAKTVGALVLMKRGNKDTGGAVELSMEGLTVNFTHRQGLSQPYGSTIEQWATEVKDAVKNYRRRPVPIM